MFYKNQISIEGRLTRQPELSKSAKGVIYCRFSIAYNQARKNKESNSWENIAHYFNCVTFNKLAENVCNYAKGDAVTLSGILQYNAYEDKEGFRRHDVSILVNDIKKLYIEKKQTEKKAVTHKTKHKKIEEPQTEETEDYEDIEIKEESPFDNNSDIPF